MTIDNEKILILGYTHEMRDFDKYQFTSKRLGSYTWIKNRLWQKQDEKCFWCKRKCNFEGTGGTSNEFTVDHIIPLSIGGTNHWMNMVGCCFKCNKQRNNFWRRNYQLIKFENPPEIVWARIGQVYDND